MRNYLSHYSGKSKRALMLIYREAYGMKNFREPRDFLWANAGPGQGARFGVYLAALAEAAQEMRKAVRAGGS